MIANIIFVSLNEPSEIEYNNEEELQAEIDNHLLWGDIVLELKENKVKMHTPSYLKQIKAEEK